MLNPAHKHQFEFVSLFAAKTSGNLKRRLQTRPSNDAVVKTVNLFNNWLLNRSIILQEARLIVKLIRSTRGQFLANERF